MHIVLDATEQTLTKYLVFSVVSGTGNMKMGTLKGIRRNQPYACVDHLGNIANGDTRVPGRAIDRVSLDSFDSDLIYRH
jgi:hypothetical protein